MLALTTIAATPLALAQSGYRIHGIAAPQVVANPLAPKLLAQLSNLQNNLKQRAQSTSLQQALEAGLLNNPELTSAYAQIQGQQWNLIAVRRQWYPTASAGSNQYILSQTFRTTTQTSTLPGGDILEYSNSANVGAIGLALNWTFFDPSRGPSINAASESLRQQQLLFNVSARNLVLQTQDAYFNLQEKQQLIKAYEEILLSTNRQVAATEAQFNSGLVSISDVEQIRTQQYQNLGALINAYRQLIDSAALLAQAMALPPGTLALPSEELQTIGQWDDSLQNTIDQALKLREEIQASLAASASASWQATSLFNNYWPRFSAGASGAYGDRYTTVGLPGSSDNTNSRNFTWDGGVGVGFTWPFFDGGISAAQAEANKAAARQAKAQAAIDRLTVTREVESTYANYLTSLLAVETTKAQVQAARMAVTSVQARFAVGVTDMATVVLTLNQSLLAASDYATALRTHNTAIAGLYRSSARWPAGTQSLLEQRVQQLRQR